MFILNVHEMLADFWFSDCVVNSLLTSLPSWLSLTPTFKTFREFALFILKTGQNKLFIRWLFSIQLELKHLVYRVLPSIPWGCFLHSDSFQLSDQFLAASPDRLSEFGEGATALKSVLCGPAVLHHAGPAGTPVTWTTDIKQAIVYIEIWSFFLFLDTVGH